MEKDPEVDEPHISDDPHPSFGGGVNADADRPRARQPNNLGVASSRPRRDERCCEMSREDAHFSDTRNTSRGNQPREASMVKQRVALCRP